MHGILTMYRLGPDSKEAAEKLYQDLPPLLKTLKGFKTAFIKSVHDERV